LKTTLMLTVFAFVSAALCIRGRYADRPTQVFVFKPLTTALILGIVLARALPNISSYAALVLAAMVFCLAGDIFLMLPDEWFVAGLSSFLVGHLFLIAAFVLGGLRPTWWFALLFCSLAITMYRVFSPYLGSMKLPVAIYVVVISVMVWLAWEALVSNRDGGRLLAALGATFFMISDSALALNRFRLKFRGADLVVLGTYWLSLWLIALSVGR